MITRDLPRGNFNYPSSYRLGCGRLSELASACRELGIARPLVITDPGVANLAWFARARERLDSEGLRHGVYSDVITNPVEQNVQDGVAAYRNGGHDACVMLGGGSALDVGKSVALMVGHTGSVFDYEDVGDNWKRIDPQRIAPMIAVPTTSGTGSEVGRASVILDVRDHRKKIIFHPKMLPPLVIADPETTFELPPWVTAATGIDAFVHSFEAFCAPGYHPMADGIALEGMRLVKEHLPACYQRGDDAFARTHMMMAASMGAAAFQKGLGLVHALAHPLGAATNVHHGLANAILLPYAIAHNRAAIADKMIRLATHLGLSSSNFDGVLRWVLQFREQIGIPHTLQSVKGMTEAMCNSLAHEALIDPSLATNPKTCTVDELEQVYRSAFSGALVS